MRYQLITKYKPVHRTLALSACLLLLAVGQPLLAQADPYLQGRALNESAEAIPYLRQATELHPDHAEYQYALGEAAFKQGDYLTARDAFLKANHLETGMGAFYLAKCEQRLGHSELAFKFLRQHLESPYKLREAELLKDEDISALSSETAWRHFWNENEWYSEQDRRFEEALYLHDRGEELDALNLLLSLEKEKYQQAEVRYRQALIYRATGNEKATLQSLQKALRYDPRHQDAQLLLVRMQMNEADWEDAIPGLTRLLNNDPGYFPAYLLRAEARSRTGQVDAAIRDLDLYQLYHPDNDSLYYLKGRTYMENGKYLSAIPQLHKAIGLEKGNAEYYFARGFCYASAGSGTLKQADKDLGMALDLDPSDGRTWYEKGIVSQRLGDKDSACHCFRKAWQLEYRDAFNAMKEVCD